MKGRGGNWESRGKTELGRRRRSSNGRGGKKKTDKALRRRLGHHSLYFLRPFYPRPPLHIQSWPHATGLIPCGRTISLSRGCRPLQMRPKRCRRRRPRRPRCLGAPRATSSRISTTQIISTPRRRCQIGAEML